MPQPLAERIRRDHALEANAPTVRFGGTASAHRFGPAPLNLPQQPRKTSALRARSARPIARHRNESGHANCQGAGRRGVGQDRLPAPMVGHEQIELRLNRRKVIRSRCVSETCRSPGSTKQRVLAVVHALRRCRDR
jgi:hypothetical protein